MGNYFPCKLFKLYNAVIFLQKANPLGTSYSRDTI